MNFKKFKNRVKMKTSDKILRNAGIFTLLLFIAVGCDSVINKSPVGMITDETVWADEALVDAYVLDVYNEANFIGGTANLSFNQQVGSVLGAEHTLFAPWQAPMGLALSVIDADGVPDAFAQWNWANIRRANTIIEKLEESELDPDFVQLRTGEVRFLRAFEYFRMVKRYGGVPLITEAQTMDDPPEEIFRSRNTEQEIYDFIAEELDELVIDLPPTNEAGRATSGAALALKSRAMLYAASIAEFGDVQLGGLLGIPSSEAQDYWQAAFDASFDLINSGDYHLFRENPDPVANYREIFTTPLQNNTEAIFGEIFNGDNKGHSFSFMALPEGPNRGWGSNFNILYEMVELFDFVDGSSGDIPRDQVTSQLWSIDEFMGERDPRLRASAFYPEVEVLDQTIYFHSSTMVNGEQVTDGDIEGWPASGPARNINRSGLHLRKRVDETQAYISHNLDETDFIVFRLGEIYMNLVEAAFYLNRPADALFYINEIRDRAGMPAYGNVTEEIVRKERQTELAFENHRYWDLRRWRIAEEVLDGLRVQGIRFDYDWDTKQYSISFKNMENQPRIFQPRHYYWPLGVERVAENVNMVPNPGYQD
ncbi:MAG: RagB/SusD family nutrient uptake outer membrane protein [Balneolales bacterium]